MQSEINDPVSSGLPSEIDSLKQRISELEAENNIIKAENAKLRARIAKLEDKQTQNELIKNLLSVSRKT
jgi:regulator of replication initiation timing